MMMTTTIWERIADTPWWIYPLVGYLFFLSFSATKPRIISAKPFWVWPTIFIPLSIFSICNLVSLTFYHVFLWIAAISFGLGLGWLQFKLTGIKAIPEQSKLYMPGTWMIAIILLATLIGKYYFHFTYSFDITLLNQPHAIPYVILGYGLLSGLFVGRLIGCIRCIKYGPYFKPSLT